jgi:hypothetical protein
MQDQSSPAEADDRIDSAILSLLLDDDSHRPWSEDEIGRAIGDTFAASDSLGRLARAGLIHRIDPYVFASRSAVEFERVAG